MTQVIFCGEVLRGLLAEQTALTEEINAALAHEDYGMLGRYHMRQEGIAKQIRTAEKDLGRAVIAWMEQQS